MTNKKSMNVLITGASGYLGGRIFEALKDDKNYSFFLGCRNSKSIATPAPEEQVRVFDISNAETFKVALQNIDAVIHLASMNFQDCEKDKALAQHLNVDMVEELIKESIKEGVSQFIYLSTFHVYGPHSEGEITEKNPVVPTNTYSRTHYEAENILLKYTNEGAIDGKVIRLSNALGYPLSPKLSAWSLVANDLCRQAMQNKKLILNSSGHQKRDFVAAACLPDAINILLNTPNEKIGNNPVFNLGSGETISILQLAEIIQNVYSVFTGESISLERKIDHSKPEDFPDFTYSIQKIQSIGFTLKKSIRDEILKTFHFLKLK